MIQDDLCCASQKINETSLHLPAVENIGKHKFYLELISKYALPSHSDSFFYRVGAHFLVLSDRDSNLLLLRNCNGKLARDT